MLFHFWKQKTTKLLSLLHLHRGNQRSAYGEVVYCGIEEAFPKAVIAETKGLYQETLTRPSPAYALISITSATIVDGRILITTRSDEKVNLRNRSVIHTPNSTELLNLPVQEPLSEADVGDVALIGFGSNPVENGRHQAVCEGILLHSSQGKTISKTSYMLNNILFLNTVKQLNKTFCG